MLLLIVGSNSQSIEASPSSTQASLAKLGTPSKHVSASSCCHALSVIDSALATRVRFTMHCCLFGAGISPWQLQSGPTCAAPHLASSVMARHWHQRAVWVGRNCEPEQDETFAHMQNLQADNLNRPELPVRHLTFCPAVLHSLCRYKDTHNGSRPSSSCIDKVKA